MTLETVQKLNEKYPFTKISDRTNWLEEFENTGWYPIILQMCEDCKELLGEEIIKYWDWYDFKEKFGGIVLYHNINLGAPMAVIEEFAQKSLRLNKVIKEAQRKTLATCYFCGKPAVDNTNGNWYIGRCEECSAEYMRKREAEGKK